jgi:Apea-like HEPN
MNICTSNSPPSQSPKTLPAIFDVRLVIMKDEKLYTLFKNFVFEIFPTLDIELEKKWIKPKYESYPKLVYNKNGMPNISNNTFETPIDIRELFRSWSGKPNIDLNEFQTYKELSNYLINHKEHRASVLPDDVDLEEDPTKFNFLLTMVITEVLERYYLLNKTKIEDEELLKNIYTEVENFTYAENLNFDIAIPILFLHFEIDIYNISENILIRKITDEHHKARLILKSYSPPIADALISSATHELVFKKYFIKKERKLFDNSLSNENAYPLQKLEMFFNALKIVTNHNSGFAQLLVYPDNWTDFFYMDLPKLKGTSIRKYPNYFDNFYWTNEKFPTINNDELTKVGTIYNNLLTNKNNKIQIANRRLRYSYLRDNDEDSILDIIIGLETLLSDNEKSELTHKLALRTAKLISIFNKNSNAIEIFELVKKIYEFRSAVVHGSSRIESKREIKIKNDAKPIKTIAIANDYLREVIGILIENPQYLEPKEIDKLLLQ